MRKYRLHVNNRQGYRHNKYFDTYAGACLYMQYKQILTHNFGHAWLHEYDDHFVTSAVIKQWDYREGFDNWAYDERHRLINPQGQSWLSVNGLPWEHIKETQNDNQR
jgi:hypothetical protein